LFAATHCANCQADDFRVDNRVFMGEQAQPQSEGTTIFQDGCVYDFLKGANEVIVFDKPQQRFVLLDLGRRVRSELTQREVEQFVARIKQRTAGSNNAMVKFLGDPNFQESFNPVTTLLRMQSEWLTYEVRLTPASSDQVAQYRDFADWYAGLNAMLYPASLPPFARIMLNKAITQHHGIAREIHLSAKNRRGEAQSLRSEYELIPKLVQEDRDRVAGFRQDMATFTAVAFGEYRKTAGQ
jgi:hypothetical protein